MKTIHHRKIRVVLLVTMAFLWAVSAAMAADKMPESAAKIQGRLVIDRVATEKIRLTIEAKEDGRIRTEIWDFIVTDHTEFVTKKGKMISFNDLKVPCSAVIHYEPSEGIQTNPAAWRVNIQKVRKNATDKFSKPEGY